jgi:hypothetical protein
VTAVRATDGKICQLLLLADGRTVCEVLGMEIIAMEVIFQLLSANFVFLIMYPLQYVYFLKFLEAGLLSCDKKHPFKGNITFSQFMRLYEAQH